MAEPTSRTEFKKRILEDLGSPVIEINVADEQIENQIDSALRYFYDYHFNGSIKTYYKHQIIADDKTNGYITLPENIIGAIRIFPLGEALSTSNIFSIQYQIALNDLYTLTSTSMVPFYSAFQHIGLIEEILVGKQPIRYNRHRDRLYIDMNWNTVNVGNYLIVEAHEVVDIDTFNESWADRWLIRYAAALVKKQWGTNLKKFSGMMMPGGLTFNGQEIYDEAVQEITELEDEVINKYSDPPSMMIG